MSDAPDARKLIAEFIGAAEDAAHPGGEPDCRLCEAVDDARAYLAAPVPAPPAEPRVPREATPEMISAGWKAYYAHPTPIVMPYIWRAMDDAAPAAEPVAPRGDAAPTPEPIDDASLFRWLCDASGKEWDALFSWQMVGRLREGITMLRNSGRNHDPRT